MKQLISFIVILTLFGIAQWAVAENSTKVDGYTIHHNALATDSLTPEIAQAYGIQRSKGRGLLTISVLKDQAGTTGMPVKADIKVHATNLVEQMRDIPVHEINEGGAIYYIGDFRVNNEETLKFQLEVTPEGAKRPYAASLSQEFFTQ